MKSTKESKESNKYMTIEIALIMALDIYSVITLIIFSRLLVIKAIAGIKQNSLSYLNLVVICIILTGCIRKVVNKKNKKKDIILWCLLYMVSIMLTLIVIAVA